MTTENGYKLESYLHQAFVESGEILKGKNLAYLLLDFEKCENISFTPDEIHKATWDAGESFVESMQGNAWDTPLDSHYTEQDRADQCAYYEAMRPSVRRLAYLETIVG